MLDIFEILGPVMIGPSSSHTAGALKIAFIAGKMVKAKPVKVKFVLYGSFARTYHGHGTDRALVGGILGYHPDDERIRDSFDHAKEAGLSFEFVEDFEDKEIYPNAVDIYVTDEEGATMSLQGKSIGGGDYEAQRRGCGAVRQLHDDDRGAHRQEGNAGLRDDGLKRLRLEHRLPASLQGEQGKDRLCDYRGGHKRKGIRGERAERV